MKFENLQNERDDMLERLHLLTGIIPAEQQYTTPEVFSLLTGTEALGITPQQIDGYQIGTLGLPFLNTPYEIKTLLRLKPCDFRSLLKASELIDCRRFGSFDMDLWKQHIREEDLLTSTAGVYQTLRRYGVSERTAFTISQKQGMRALGNMYGDKAFLRELERCNVPDEYIYFLKDIAMLPTQKYNIEEIHAALQLLWFKLYYPVEFYSASLSVAKRHDEHFRIPRNALEMSQMLKYAEHADPDDPHTYTPFRCILLTFKECIARGVQLIPPVCGDSHGSEFLPEGDKIRMPLDTMHYCQPSQIL